jgi:two-component sensor histidine kinase
VASELIMNCLKHAFPGQRAGSIEITVGMSNGHRQVEIRDDGIGLGRDFSPENFNSFGWLMISNLMKQLEGTISVVSDGGTTCRMIF